MLTTSCPKCEKEVTVPGSASADSRVRCPLCSEEYTLQSVFADMPPLLELLDVPATNGAATVVEDDREETTSRDDSRGMFDFDSPADTSEAGEKTDEDGDIALADAEDVAPKAGGFDFGEDSTPAAASVGGGVSARSAARPRKKEASPAKLIIGVIIGGLCAAPVAQMILWWLPGNWDIEQHDPMGIARNYPGSLGLLAPASVRNHTEGESNPPVDNNVQHPGATTPPDPDALANVDDTPSSLGRDDLAAALRGDPPDDKPRDQGGDTILPPPDVGEPPDVDGPPKVNQGGNNNGGNSGSNSGSGNTKPPVGVKNAPSFTTKELSQEIQTTKDAMVLLDAAADTTLDGKERVAKASEFVNVASKLAEVATFAEDRPVGHREHLDELLADAGGSHDKRRFIGALARRRLEDKDREGSGLIVVAVVEEIRKRGQLYETVMKIDTTDNPPVSVYGPKDPAGAFAAGEMVVLLGVVVDDPKENIRGYQGPPVSVVWGGYSQVVPPDAP